MSSTTLDLAWVKPYRATFAEHAQSSIDGFRAHVEEHQTWLSSFLEDAMKKVEEYVMFFTALDCVNDCSS